MESLLHGRTKRVGCTQHENKDGNSLSYFYVCQLNPQHILSLSQVLSDAKMSVYSDLNPLVIEITAELSFWHYLLRN